MLCQINGLNIPEIQMCIYPCHVYLDIVRYWHIYVYIWQAQPQRHTELAL